MSDEDGQHLPQRQHDRRRGGVSQQIAQFEQVHTELNKHGCGLGGHLMGGILLGGDEQCHLSGGGRHTKGRRGCAIDVFERMEEVPLEYAVIFFLVARRETPSLYTSRS